ncbi:hypothetical protein C0J52_21855 [Blattella germanica]|nr:hypothetical protein C0J52_21855 [Blattella germanica]
MQPKSMQSSIPDVMQETEKKLSIVTLLWPILTYKILAKEIPRIMQARQITMIGKASLQNTMNNIHQLRKNRRFRALRAHNVEDSDYQFLVSLLPYLHEVSAQNKLRVRMEMMNVLFTEQAERNNLRQPISNLQPTRSPSFSSISSSHTCSNDFTMSDPSTSSFYENFDPHSLPPPVEVYSFVFHHVVLVLSILCLSLPCKFCC